MTVNIESLPDTLTNHAAYLRGEGGYSFLVEVLTTTAAHIRDLREQNKRLRSDDIVDRLNRWLQYPVGAKIPSDLVGDLINAVATIERLRKQKD